MPKKAVATVSENVNSIQATFQGKKHDAVNKQRGTITTNPDSNNSTIAQMHFQNGLSSFKDDLARKIQNYQSIMKKTYQEKRP